MCQQLMTMDGNQFLGKFADRTETLDKKKGVAITPHTQRTHPTILLTILQSPVTYQ